MTWAAILLGVLGAWIAISFAIECLAWRASRLGRRPPPACFRAPPRRGGGERSASLVFLGDVQRGIADVARPLAAALEERPADLLVSSGDLAAHGEAPYYGVLLEAFDRAGIDTPVRAVPGNHDLFPR
ncbi:MAG: metallophosphoesterase, partial [Planctomycetota bacterium]